MENNEVQEETKKIEEINQNNSNFKKETLTNKFRKNPWMLSTLVLGIIVILLLIGNMGMTGKVISEDEAGKIVLNFAEQQTGDKLDLVEIKETSGLYEIIVLYEGQELPLYLTKDGKNLVSGVTPLSFFENLEQIPSQQTSTSYSENDLEKLKEFNECLAEKELVIYGAEWCGYCQQVVTTLGGYDIASSVYVECEDDINKAICAEKVETGYPTIKIKDQSYNGARTLEAFSQATGCPIPNF